MILHAKQRKGTTLVESAIVYPVVTLLLFGLIVGAMGVFRYQQVAHLAREGSRYASVHGKQYEKATGFPAATPQEVYDNAIAPNAVAYDMESLEYSVTWDTDNGVYHSALVNGKMVTTRNSVRVTVSYQWIPETYFGGVRLSSTSEMPMCY
jgi:Flp pilus assembly protein TadG